MLPNISHSDLGNPTTPGEYPFEGGFVKVDGFHIAAWTSKPNAVFNSILCTRIGDGVLRLALGQTEAQSS